MLYKRGIGPDDLVPDIYWCLQHGVEAAWPPNDQPYCWRCLSDCKVVNGENIIKCRVIHLGDALKGKAYERVGTNQDHDLPPVG